MRKLRASTWSCAFLPLEHKLNTSHPSDNPPIASISSLRFRCSNRCSCFLTEERHFRLACIHRRLSAGPRHKRVRITNTDAARVQGPPASATKSPKDHALFQDLFKRIRVRRINFRLNVCVLDFPPLGPFVPHSDIGVRSQSRCFILAYVALACFVNQLFCVQRRVGECRSH
jgi:hypothetical protein